MWEVSFETEFFAKLENSSKISASSSGLPWKIQYLQTASMSRHIPTDLLTDTPGTPAAWPAFLLWPLTTAQWEQNARENQSRVEKSHYHRSRVGSLICSPRRGVFVLRFYMPLNIYSSNVKVTERCSSLVVGAGVIWDKVPEERKPTSQSWLGRQKQMHSAQKNISLHLKGHLMLEEHPCQPTCNNPALHIVWNDHISSHFSWHGSIRGKFCISFLFKTSPQPLES